ncbi:hypothetical protein ACNFJ7_13630 [Sphingomonas sp. HT-1]|uniref:hypothetical protein n=1 Tax=unclassified Sphingomonas TaxID=196159 RepID=UPI00030CB1A7|nr:MULTISPECIES: hypothetical protein [unclassified Sphingomonas]KTF68046.1 hypothetical protein ATB93_15845 [Sphingomonas sp. WG]
MSSISALSTSAMMSQSPRDRINARISAAVSSGDISAADQSAFSTALDSIDSTLSAERSRGAKPSGDMKAKMESLIQAQVDNGTLTEEQATELKGMFAKGAGGPKGPDGLPPPQEAGAASEDESDSITTTSVTSDAASAALDTVSLFLQQLREANEDTTSYAASGDTSKSCSTKSTGLVVDTRA